MGSACVNSHLKLLEDCLIEIFFRCSVKSLLCAKCVCKKWHFLIKEPNFLLNHIRYQKIHSKGRLLFLYRRKDKKNRINIALFDDETLGKGTYRNLIELLNGSSIHIEGPVNGLYCLFGDNNRIVLWNPSLMDFKIVPLPYHHFFPHVDAFYDQIGFGIDGTHDYKLVLFRYGCGVEIRHYVTVYNPTTNTWKLLYDLRFSPLFNNLHLGSHATNVFLNGTNYWATYYYIYDGNEPIAHFAVIAFDLEEETFRMILGPSNLDYHDFVNFFLTLYNDKIALIDGNQCRADLWVMHEEGMWIKQFSFTSLPENFTILGPWKNDGFLFDAWFDFMKKSRIILYSAGNQEKRYIGPKANRLGSKSFASVYYESLALVYSGIGHNTSLKTVSDFLDQYKDPYLYV